MIYTEATLDHNRGTDTATIGAVHDDLVQPTEEEDTTKDLTMTLHASHIAHQSSQHQSSLGY